MGGPGGKANPFETDLERNAANHAPLSPLSFLERTAAIWPERIAVIHGRVRRNWRETASRCRQFASALTRAGIGCGDTVAVMAPNSPAAFEAHFGVPMAGAVLNALNTRQDAQTIAFILEHGEAKLVFCDRELSAVMQEALKRMRRPLPVIDIADSEADMASFGPQLGERDYEAFLATGDAEAPWQMPEDEWQAIALNYTSGTTGNPKGVVYHHRGAFLNAVGNVVVWSMPHHPVYLWTLPMFHCNGWCFPWTVTAVGGTHVCLRRLTAATVFEALAEHAVTHLCGAPVVLNMLVNAKPHERRKLPHMVEMMTAAAPPPPSVIAAIEREGIHITHVYGLTEVYGPAVVCAWHSEWDALPEQARAQRKARQGVAYPVLEGLEVAHPETLEPVPRDGRTMGEVLMRGNIVMKGYLKNPDATAKAFKGGWFHTGDLGVMHPDGYIELKDRSKDIIISGGENISTIEVETVLYRHPAVLEAAVVAKPDPQWGEVPCAFVTLKDGAGDSEADIIGFCRQQMAHFKAPKTVVFGPLPKTSTGKIQKFVLRERAKALRT
jgi:fatty-acyl-CoA synthase